MEKVRPWCGQPSDRGRLKNRTEPLSVQSRVYVTVERPSVCPPVCPSVLSVCSIRPPHASAAGLLLCALGGARHIDRLLHGWRAGAQQQRRRSTALSSKCEQCHVDS